MTLLRIQKTVCKLQTIAPTLWKVLGVSVSLNMTLIDSNEKYQAHHVWQHLWQQQVTLKLYILTWVLYNQ